MLGLRRNEIVLIRGSFYFFNFLKKIALFFCLVIYPVHSSSAKTDCSSCPEMKLIPAGNFVMGFDHDKSIVKNERPAHEVHLKKSFYISQFEITFDQWDACLLDGGCGSYHPKDEGWGRGSRPVINVSWDDAILFTQWLSAKANKPYRLPSEAEWEYAARAGSQKDFHFGSDEKNLCIYGNHADASSNFFWKNSECDDGTKHGTAKSGRYRPNQFGLYDMHGNVWEWTQDCYFSNYVGAPNDGTARTGACYYRSVRGGSWNVSATHLRSSNRFMIPHRERHNYLGFRVVRDAEQPK